MRLYLFEHCSVCFRVRMAAALKRLHLQETVVLEDDSDTMTRLVGKRVGQPVGGTGSPGNSCRNCFAYCRLPARRQSTLMNMGMPA